MKIGFLKKRSARSRIFAGITISVILIALAVNLIFTHIAGKNSVIVDLTPEGLYTLSDKMIEECSFIDDLKNEDGTARKMKITFCADPDALMNSTVMRVIYMMSLQLQCELDNIVVETVNVRMDPTAVAEYKTTALSSIKPSDIIISCADRYRIVSAESFWATDSSNNNALWAYNGEYKMASIFLSLTTRNQPKAYFVENHGESCDFEGDAYQLAALLGERGLSVHKLDLSAASGVPDDCAVLIINNPRVDFDFDSDELGSLEYVSETEKIDRYLSKNDGSLMVSLDYSLGDSNGDGVDDLYNLREFLKEWGFSFSDTKVKDKDNSLADINGTGTNIIGVYNTDENSYGNAVYGQYSSSASSPKVIVSNTGYISCSFGNGLTNSMAEQGSVYVTREYDEFLTTSDGAVAYAWNEAHGDYSDIATVPGKKAIAAVTARMTLHSTDSTYKYSYVFAANSPDFFSNEVLGNASYANFDIMSAVVDNFIRTDSHASNELGGSSFNSPTIGGKQLVSTAMSEVDTEIWSADAKHIIGINKGLTGGAVTAISIFVYAVPAAIAVLGIIVCLKRKFL